MDNYLKYFNENNLKTEEVFTATECSEVLEVFSRILPFKILQNNIRSIYKKMDKFKVFLYQQEISF